MFWHRETDNLHALGLPPATTNQPASNQDAHFWLSVRSTRIPSLLDRQGCWSIRSLSQLSSAQDGGVRCLYQRAFGPFSDQHTATNVFWEDEFDGEDHADSR